MARERKYKSASVRSAVHRAAIQKEGGQRLDLLLSVDGAGALKKLRERWQCKSNTETVETALLALAQED